MTLSSAYEILTGVGTLYIADAGTAAPAVNETPDSSDWTELGETDDGVKITKSDEYEKLTTDQRTGAVKAVRTEETLVVETNLAQATLENLAAALGGATVTDTAPTSTTIGTRSMGLHLGGDVNEYAFLFRANSPYGDYLAQFYIPRGFFSGEVGMEYKKDDKVLIPVTFEALENLSASSDAEKFGTYTAQDAAATA